MAVIAASAAGAESQEEHVIVIPDSPFCSSSTTSAPDPQPNDEARKD